MRRMIAAGVVWGVIVGAAPAEAQGMRIGVVNIEKVMRDYKKLKDQQARLEAKGRQVRTEVRAKEKQFQQVKEKRDLFSKGTKEYNQHNRDMIRVKNEARSVGEAAEQELRVETALALANAYNEIVDGIKNYGREQRYALILRFNDDKITGTNPKEVTMQIGGRRVLFSSTQMDLTLIILDRLNKAYEAQQGGAR